MHDVGRGAQRVECGEMAPAGVGPRVAAASGPGRPASGLSTSSNDERRIALSAGAWSTAGSRCRGTPDPSTAASMQPQSRDQPMGKQHTTMAATPPPPSPRARGMCWGWASGRSASGPSGLTEILTDRIGVPMFGVDIVFPASLRRGAAKGRMGKRRQLDGSARHARSPLRTLLFFFFSLVCPQKPR